MILLKDLHLLREKAYINGHWVEGSSHKTFPVTNPANGETIAQVADLGAGETRSAIEAAATAQPEWQAKTAADRAEILRRFTNLLRTNKEDLALLMTTEQGKPLAESRGEIDYSVSFFEWFAEEARRIYGDVIPTHHPNLRNIVIKQPIGVVSAITPWNFPIAMVAKKLPAALAAGCTFVWKPAEDTPLCGLALAELGERAGLPPGVFNVVTTSDAATVGKELTTNPLVRKVSFTGSTEVGKMLLHQSADTVKKVSLELGGNAPFIVFDDADIDAAVSGAIASKFRNAGQTCVCANRILVQDAIYDDFTEKFTAAVSQLTVGNGVDERVDIGPLIAPKTLEKVENLIGDARENGAEIILGGSRHSLGGNFFQPTVLTNVTESAEMAQTEIFGPVAPLYRFTSERSAIKMANNTRFGLAAYFYTRDIGRIWRVSEALEYGIVGVNTGMVSTAVAPFGGVKESGIGREGSKYGIEEYLETKFICHGGITENS
ncbi:MAG: NAD-dependent succinate-semialdehyde dehydrogenase [Calditrichia bacterium]